MHVRARRHKKIPARPLLIDYGLAGIRLMASTSPFLALRPPFLVLTQEKEAKESQGVRDAGEAGRIPGQTSLAAAAAPLTLSLLLFLS